MGNACCGWADPGAPSVVLDRQSVARMADAACCNDQQPAQTAANRSCSQIRLPNLRVEDVYEFGRTLGTGGFSAVKLVSHRATGKKYACKIMLLPPPGVDVREDILRESKCNLGFAVNILIGLEHPNVVDLKECFFAGRPNLVRRSVQSLFAQPFTPLSDDGGGVYGEKVYLIMEVLHGGELLDAIMAKGSYTESDARTIFCQIVSGLSYLHSRGVIHRDLKLSNLLLARPGDITQVKIADFGLARSAAAAGDAVAAAGTPHYMAPEVVEAALQGHTSSPLSLACDIWSLGVCLFILLGGYPPFDDADEQRLLRKIRRGRFSFHGQVWKTISHEARDLIRQLLVLDPLKRPSAQQVSEHPWVGRGGFAAKAAAASRASLSIHSERMPGPHPAVAAGAPHESLLSQLLEGLREEEGAQ